MIWAAINIYVFGLLHSEEICAPSASAFNLTTHLASFNVSLINLSSPSKMFARIKALKTDRFRSGVMLVHVANNRDHCTIAAPIPYLSIWGQGQRVAFYSNLKRLAGIEASLYTQATAQD